MSCCIPGRGAGIPGGGRRIAASSASRAPSAVQSVFFQGGRSFVGTDRPVLVDDGEGPRRAVTLRPFRLETVPVTNARFAAFVAATGYLTQAERFGWSPVFNGLLVAEPRPVSNSATPWWVPVRGACWSTPEGPGSDIADRGDHPVVQVSWADARAFAEWCGGRLPGEAEWEHAARGGLDDPRFPWGDAEPDDTTIFANIWQGSFPDRNDVVDGYFGTSPVEAFPPNGAGLYGMAGNIWEWTSDAFRVRSLGRNARRRNTQASAMQEKVAKGGSFLCHHSYCYRYRIAARMALASDSCGSNVGFRVAYDA